MIWIDSINDLQYYKQSKDLPCYCEELVYPNDMQLQGRVYNGSGSYTLALYVYSADGLTQYENATTYFDYYFAKMPNGTHFFNARLKSFTPAMCAHKCFIIRAVVSQGGKVLFDKYTERYCQSSCCDVARGVTYSQDSLSATPVPSAPVVPAGTPVTSECGEPLIRIISQSDCEDVFSGEFYGIPGTVLSGSASFGYTKVTSCKGRIVRRPLEIKREISYNCKLQSSESAALYLLEGFEYFPAWKMAEIEAQLHASHIWVDDYKTYREYQYEGGIPFRQIHDCYELFKLETVVQDCTKRQVFGCADCAPASGAFFAIPEAYEGGAFYNESGMLIAQDYDELLVWLASQDGIVSVEDVDVETLSCPMYAAVGISGGSYLPTAIYYDKVNPRNRVFAHYASSADSLCDVNGGIACRKPVNDEVIIEAFVCNTPAHDTVIIEAVMPDAVPVYGFGSWVIDGGATAATVIANELSLDISVTNSSIIAEEGTEYSFSGEIIATIAAGGRPTVMRILDHNNNGDIPAGMLLLVEPSGAIRFVGTITITTENEAAITLENLNYTI